MPIVKRTAEDKARLREAFGAGLIIFGQKHPAMIAANSKKTNDAKKSPEKEMKGNNQSLDKRE